MANDVQYEVSPLVDLPPVVSVHGRDNSPEMNTYPAPTPPPNVCREEPSFPYVYVNGDYAGCYPTTTVVTVAAKTPEFAGSSLPVTGGDIVGLLLLGLLAVAVGSILNRGAKRG